MFWLPVRLLVGLRWRLALRALQRPPVLVGLLLALFVLAPGALAVARTYHAQFRSLPDGREAALRGLLAGVYALWLLVLSRGVAAGREVEPAGLRGYPVHPFQVALGATIAALLDVPLLLVLPAFGAIVASFGHGTMGVLFVVAALVLFLVQTAALGQVLTQAVGLILRPQRVVPLLVLSIPLLGAACYAMSSSSPKAPTSPLPFVSRQAEAKVTRAAPPAGASPSPNTLARWTPPGLAAGAIASASRARSAAAGGFLAGLALATLATLGAAAALLEVAAKRQESGGGQRTARPARAAARPRTKAVTTARPWDIIAVVALQEIKGFTRDPFALAALRQPANLLLLFAFAWIQPNLGQDAERNVRDLLSLGALFYVVLWQMQWLCNRLGGDGGAAALMLLRYPAPRPLLLAGKNFALGILLLGVDGTGLALFCAWAHAAPGLLVTLLGWLIPTLIVLSALGNLVSVWQPFPLAGRVTGNSAEPDRSLALVYVGVGLATTALLVPVRQLLALAGPGGGGPWLAFPLIVIYLGGVYGLCLHAAARTLARRETRILRRLERG